MKEGKLGFICMMFFPTYLGLRCHMTDLVERYNYHSFTRELVEPWLNFSESPSVGEVAPSFPIWQLDGKETSLKEQWRAVNWLVVEFGSFT